MTVAEIGVIRGIGCYSLVPDAEELVGATPYGDSPTPVAPSDVAVPDHRVDGTDPEVLPGVGLPAFSTAPLSE